VADATRLFHELNSLRQSFEDWRLNLPPYYEPQDVPVEVSGDDELDILGYPYKTFHSYVAGKSPTGVSLKTAFLGHTLNIYRAAILNIDLFLLECIFVGATISESQVW
jgi:hypothetical protein